MDGWIPVIAISQGCLANFIHYLNVQLSLKPNSLFNSGRKATSISNNLLLPGTDLKAVLRMFFLPMFLLAVYILLCH